LPFISGQTSHKPDENFCLFFEDLRALICYSRVPRLLKRPLTTPSFGQTRGNICPKGIARIDRVRYVRTHGERNSRKGRKNVSDAAVHCFRDHKTEKCRKTIKEPRIGKLKTACGETLMPRLNKGKSVRARERDRAVGLD
jgi:hypothetical protein